MVLEWFFNCFIRGSPMYVIATPHPSPPRITEKYNTQIIFLDDTLENYTTNLSEAKLYDSYEEAIDEAKEDVSNHDFVLHYVIAKQLLVRE